MSSVFPLFRLASIKKRTYIFFLAAVFAVIAGVLFGVTYYSIAPRTFPERDIVTIKRDMYLSQAADTLAANSIIRSPFFFKLYVVLFGGSKKIIAGDYLFDTPQSALRIAYRTVHGIQNIPQIKVTFFEGMAVKEMAAVFHKDIPNFDVQTFLALAKPHEGYLFPDTYFFYETVTPQDALQVLQESFIQKIKPDLLSLQAFGKPIEDVITMASLVEKEATSSEDRKIIAGILWSRLKNNMPLQVDPPFYYFLGKVSSGLTLNDLATDSPYNLYKHTGLPPTPITNPGLDAIEDTISPTSSKYVYFLFGKDGRTHYAETYDQHVANKRKYLD